MQTHGRMWQQWPESGRIMRQCRSYVLNVHLTRAFKTHTTPAALLSMQKIGQPSFSWNINLQGGTHASQSNMVWNGFLQKPKKSNWTEEECNDKVAWENMYECQRLYFGKRQQGQILVFCRSLASERPLIETLTLTCFHERIPRPTSYRTYQVSAT